MKKISLFQIPGYLLQALHQSLPFISVAAGPNLAQWADFPVENYQRLVVSALHGARRRVIITTPYFVPDEPLLQAIQIAVWRGVQIDLIGHDDRRTGRQ